MHSELINIDYLFLDGDVKKILNYFFYYQMAEAYAMDHRSQFNLFKDIVKQSNLSPSDQHEYKKMEIRSKMPIILKKMWNSK
jgi:transcription initiation factor IIF auxiliary subunit